MSEFETLSVHAGYEPDWTGAVMPPIYATSTFRQQSPGVHAGYEYGRSQNPTRQALQHAIAELEAAPTAMPSPPVWRPAPRCWNCCR